MYSYEYPHPALTTDCVVFGFDGSGLNLLLVERGLKPYKGKWALPGGFVRIDEETGVMDIYIEQLQAFSRVDRDPRERVVTVAFLAFVRQEGYEVIAGDDAAKAQWFPVDMLPDLAFDHSEIVRVALDKLRWKITYEPLAFRLLNKEFTMTQVQTIYEAVLGQKFDRRNFHKKMTAMGYIVATDGVGRRNYEAFDILNEYCCEKMPVLAARAPRGSGRPATLYTFDEAKYREQINNKNVL